jgi:hypothetical protein
MSSVLLVTAAMLVVGAVLMAAFLPARAPKADAPRAIEGPQPVGA